jgi:hypothetical protein
MLISLSSIGIDIADITNDKLMSLTTIGIESTSGMLKLISSSTINLLGIETERSGMLMLKLISAGTIIY